MGLLFINLIIIEILAGIVFLLLFAVLIWMLLDVLKSEFKNKYAKQFWIVLLTFLPVIGMMFYHNFKRKRKLKLKGD